MSDSARWCDYCGPKRGFGDHHTDRHEDFEFKGNLLRLPNGDSLVRRPGLLHYRLLGPKGGVRHAAVHLMVHGMDARDEEQFVSFLNGDAHDQSKCQVYARGPKRKIWNVS